MLHMNNQSSAAIWTTSSTPMVTVLEPNTGEFGRSRSHRVTRSGAESLMKLALLVTNSATWVYVAVLPVGLV